MMYEFKGRPLGKSFAQMIQLNINLKNGLSCMVATLNPNKVKLDFEYMTGMELTLEPVKDNNNLYLASISNDVIKMGCDIGTGKDVAVTSIIDGSGKILKVSHE